MVPCLSSVHHLMVCVWARARRMKVEVEEMAAKKRAIAEVIAEKRRFLESLPSQLKAIEKVPNAAVRTVTTRTPTIAGYSSGHNNSGTPHVFASLPCLTMW